MNTLVNESGTGSRLLPLLSVLMAMVCAVGGAVVVVCELALYCGSPEVAGRYCNLSDELKPEEYWVSLYG